MPGDFANSFAKYFNMKVINNSEKARVNTNVYNGRCQLIVAERHFMNLSDVEKCMKDLNRKKCEGFDQVPLCTLFDACAVLVKPLAILFDKIYRSCTIPDQWKISKIIPLYKKR